MVGASLSCINSMIGVQDISYCLMQLLDVVKPRLGYKAIACLNFNQILDGAESGAVRADWVGGVAYNILHHTFDRCWKLWSCAIYTPKLRHGISRAYKALDHEHKDSPQLCYEALFAL